MLLRKKELLNVVEKALHATNTTSTQELHHCLRIRTDNNRLIAEGASPSVTITAIKECDESLEQLDIVVQAKMFKDIITKCKDDISLETTTKGSLKIKSGSMSFTTEYKSPSIWLVKPPFEEKESYQLDSDFFKETAHCLSKRDNDKMNCYCLEVGESGYQVTTLDGHRISVRTGITQPNEETTAYVIQGSLLSLAMKFCNETLEIGLDNERIQFHSHDNGEQLILEGMLFSKDYFNITKVLEGAKSSISTSVTVNKSDLLGALSVTNMLSDCTILETEKGFLKISNKRSPIGNTENLISSNTDGKSLRIGLSGKFLEEAVRSMHSDEITLKFNGPKSPILLEEDGAIEFILPITIAA